ncbi:hypothetical protein SCHPADRAFT_825557 [Schizopora paradoxa]|uniref:Uncharacterized protein n=1 Tax=Schizopora paradoxa TaxID=27342 RepID=A0A0H2RT29_9AGAM|nr:hypothetical protein SCHPADRAFT_825557 [Schizopora paradoxa]
MTVPASSSSLPALPTALLDQLASLAASSQLNADPALLTIHAHALFARLKALNRGANAAVRTHKQASAEERLELDATHLQLQNLQYEKRHLEREIAKCLQFGSVYQDVPLHSLEEFEELAPVEARTDEVMNDTHQLMLNRLSFELVEQLLAEKEELSKQSKVKQTTIDSVKSQIDTLVKTAADIQKKVDDMVAAIPLPPDTA